MKIFKYFAIVSLLSVAVSCTSSNERLSNVHNNPEENNSEFHFGPGPDVHFHFGPGPMAEWNGENAE